ncbi:hypothetical protein Q73_02845 [Bacillus coahuilensis m2-6]|nr:hypothetical protein Q73_02845 [Bacillus coahuilensis m2-6]
MGLLIVRLVAYLPIFYRIHKRLDSLEKEVKRLSDMNRSKEFCVNKPLPTRVSNGLFSYFCVANE